jgi:hypothetical protein
VIEGLELRRRREDLHVVRPDRCAVCPGEALPASCDAGAGGMPAQLGLSGLELPVFRPGARGKVAAAGGCAPRGRPAPGDR